MKHTIFSAISNDTRRRILYILDNNQDKQATISQINKQIPISSQLLGKHLKVLSEYNLIKKIHKKRTYVIQITLIGNAIMNQLYSVEFFEENKEYFLTHSLDYLPKQFVIRLGELHDCKKIKGIGNTIQKYEEILERSHKSVKIQTSQSISDVYKKGVRTMNQKENYSVRVIYGKNTIFQKGFKKLRKECMEDEMIKSGKVKQRVANHINDVMIISETEAGILFPKSDGFLDPTVMFYSKDPMFRKWCNDLYEHTWERAEIFSEDKIREQE